jgi:hypothetical protein
MTVQSTAPTESSLHERLGGCPRCRELVLANAEAVRYADHWYHLRCALEQQAEPGEDSSPTT